VPDLCTCCQFYAPEPGTDLCRTCREMYERNEERIYSGWPRADYPTRENP